jgi:hypothetical protein
MEYGLKEYKRLLEQAIDVWHDPYSVPFGMDSDSDVAHMWRRCKQEAITWAIEMMPEEKQ